MGYNARMMSIITVPDPAAVLLGTHALAVLVTADRWRDHLTAGLGGAIARLYGRHF